MRDHVATCEHEIREAVLHALGRPSPTALMFDHRDAVHLCELRVHAALTKLAARVANDVRLEMLGPATSPSLPIDVYPDEVVVDLRASMSEALANLSRAASVTIALNEDDDL